MYTIYNINNTNTYIIELFQDDKEYNYLSTCSNNISEKTRWYFKKTPKYIYKSNIKYLKFLCEIDFDIEKLTIALLTDKDYIYL